MNVYDEYTSEGFNSLIEKEFNIEAERVVPLHKFCQWHHHLCHTTNLKPKLFFPKVTPI